MINFILWVMGIFLGLMILVSIVGALAGLYIKYKD